ncbi:MAG: glycosyltransferase family 2 protein [Bacteroidota bacterium]
MEILYLVLLGTFLLLFYSYIGYGLSLYSLVVVKRVFRKTVTTSVQDWPEATLVVAAYNEETYVEDKILNSLQLDYPDEKLKLLFVTDGSDDRTVNIIQQYPQIQLEHQTKRQGKIAAVERIMPLVKSPITVYTDANTYLNPEAIKNMVRHFADPQVGGVAGEKRIRQSDKDDASAAGEGIYWKYESTLKQWDYELHSVVGAAGELFAIRTELYEPVQKDTLIEDFYMTLRIAQRGYRVAYEKEAYATEDSSASIQEEMKRKVRIAAGGIQAIIRLARLLIPYPNPVLTFQYISHRVLRWTLAPLALLIFLIVSGILAVQNDPVGQVLLGAQLLFYGLAYVGYRFEKKEVSVKALYIPLYFSMMNLAVYRGAWRLWKGQQSVVWDKAQRKAKA